MKLLSLILGALALPLASGVPAQAAEKAAGMEIATLAFTLPSPEMASVPEPTYQLAQASDPRVMGLEEQVRQLNGRIEEMNFQILQMQEQMRKMQEDVDFRLQDLEQKRTDAGGAAPSSQPEGSVADAPAQAPPAPAAAQAQAPAPPAEGPGAPEKPLGSIVFDQSGNLVGGTIDTTLAEEADTDGETVAALPPSASDPKELYRNSYEAILSGDYGTAEAGFRQHIERFPGDPQTADARFWLGESLLGQSRYRDAVEVFVDANKAFPDSRKSPDMLLKLGVSLSALNQRDVACATFTKIGQRYPKSSDSFKNRVKQERALAGC